MASGRGQGEAHTCDTVQSCREPSCSAPGGGGGVLEGFLEEAGVGFALSAGEEVLGRTLQVQRHRGRGSTSGMSVV